MNQFWSPFVASLNPYVPGEQPLGSNIIKLNTNENPFPPSPQVQEAMSNLSLDALRRYPDPESTKLSEVIAKYHGVDVDNVFVGNGSDEVLAHAFNAFFRQSKPILFPDITYSFYPVYCQLYGINFQTLPLSESFQLDLAEYERVNGGVIFANPNAPTGIIKPVVEIERLLSSNQQSVVLVDEAYIDFVETEKVADASAISLVNRYSNLLVTRTLSKSRSLAGIRLGYAVGDKALIEGLKRVKNSFNSYPVDAIANVLALASFSDEQYFEHCRQRVITNRKELESVLKKLGFSCLPSAANFIMTRHATVPSVEIFEALRQRNVIIRYFSQPRIDKYLRITVGSESANQTLISELENILL